MITAPIIGSEQTEPYVLIRDWEIQGCVHRKGPFFKGTCFWLLRSSLLEYYLDCN